MIKGFHHAAISTPDLQRCIEFYTQVIGGEVAWTFGWPAGTPEADEVTGLQNSAADAAMLKIGENFLEVFQFSSPSSPEREGLRPVNHYGITHICLEVEDINAEYERLTGLGVEFRQEPMEAGHVKIATFDDTCGNYIQLIEMLEEV